MKKSIDQVYGPEVLGRLQQTELGILKTFDKLCQKHGLSYFALYGTALGQVRHGGFIPWDDDIDVGLMRQDYEKLKDLVASELSDEYTFIDGMADPRYPFVTGRIMKKGTEFRMLSMKNAKYETGIFLDIFCFDYMPEDPALMAKTKRKCWVLEKMNILRNMPMPNLPYRGFTRVVVRVVCAVASVVMKLFPRKVLQRWVREAPQVMQGKKTSQIGWPFCVNPNQSLYPVDMIFPLQRLPFEDMMLSMPRDPDGMLRTVFGDDYMTPLPEGQRSFIIPYRLSFGDGEIYE